jgi:hypothetical protein
MSNHTRIAIVGTLVVVTCLTAYIGHRGFIHPLVIGWPISVDSAADKVIGQLSEEQKTQLASTKHEDLGNYHLGLGLYIRNQFGLWQGNGALLSSACGECDPDDASMVIIERIWTKVREKTR